MLTKKRRRKYNDTKLNFIKEVNIKNKFNNIKQYSNKINNKKKILNRVIRISNSTCFFQNNSTKST